MRNLLLGLLLCVSIGACTDAERAKISALGDPAKIILYSGGSVVAEFCSSGKVHSESNSDGYYFSDKATGLPTEISGDVVIQYMHVDCR